MYQQLMSRIGSSSNVVNAEYVNNPGPFAPPSTWEELKLAILDILQNTSARETDEHDSTNTTSFRRRQ